MKKTIITILLFVAVTQTNACPFCGCGGGNLYMGLMPDFQKAFVGLRYHYSQFHTTLFSDPSQFSTNYYNTIEAYGGVNIGKRFQVLAFIPYYQNKQVDDDGTTTPHGLGDITVMGQYMAFNSTSLTAGKKVLQQQLWVGAGLKVPTGSFNLDLSNPDVTVADINAQLGTASTDVLLNAMYSVRLENFGVNVSGNYKLNTVNKQGYQYGNKLTGNVIGYYLFGVKHLGISPNAGIGYENVAGNTLHTEKVQYTGSKVTNAIIGVELNLRKIGFGINGQLPIAQSFAEGQTQLKFKAMAHLTYSL